MTTTRERILLVESDPEICDLVARQTLQPSGYRVEVVGAAAQAIQEAVRFAPDVIIANLTLPGLSGKDLLVALSSQGLEVPIIVIAEKGLEGDVIQAFRLGAADYLLCPLREAEVISAVERVLKQGRARREREALAKQLNQTNQELQRRVRELTTIFAIGKAMTSITNQRALLDKVVEGAVYVSEADSGWLLLREERGKNYLLAAYRNLPQSIGDKLNQPWEDGISSLVALSGEALSIHGEPLKRFKVSRLGQSALVVPIKIKKEVVGLLVVVRKAATPFGPSNQSLLEAVADYASISLVNAHLFKALEERARSLQHAAENAQVSERIKDEILRNVNSELASPLKDAREQVDVLLSEKIGILNTDQFYNVRLLHDKLNMIQGIIDTLAALQKSDSGKQSGTFELNDLARKTVARFQRIAHQAGIIMLTEMAPAPLNVGGNSTQIGQVLDALLSNAIRYNKQGGQVTLRVERSKEGEAHVLVCDTGLGIETRHLPHIFDSSLKIDGVKANKFGGLGISLALVKEIITTHGGKIWVESELGKGTTVHFVLTAQSIK